MLVIGFDLVVFLVFSSIEWQWKGSFVLFYIKYRVWIDFAYRYKAISLRGAINKSLALRIYIDTKMRFLICK